MKLVKNNLYLLLIDEESRGIAFGEIGVNMRHSELEVETRNMGGYGSDKYYWSHKKIIAYYPLTKEAKELDLPLLPPFEEVDVEKLALKEYPDGCDGTDMSATIYRRIFIEGYKAAQSKQFSLEDIRDAFRAGSDFGSSPFSGQGKELIDENKYIQSLSTKQLPKEFEPLIEIYDFDHGVGRSCIPRKILKITTNSEGKEVLVGKYKY